MVRKRRVSKKSFFGKSTEPVSGSLVADEFTQRWLWVFVAAVVLIIALTAGWFWRKHDNRKNEETAANLFYKAYQVYEDAKAKDNALEEPMGKFQTIVEKYPRTSSGKLSLFYLGNCRFSLKQFDEAIVSYNKFLEDFSSQPQFTILAYDSLGYCYEEKKDYQKALEYFQKTIDPHPGLGEIGYLNVGRCYDALGDKDGSLKIYKRFIVEFPDSRKKSFVEEKIRKLEAKSGGMNTDDAVPEPD